MRDKRTSPLRLEGRGVVLEEIQPKYFPEVIRWRNDKELNRFLNQPEELTMEKETAWYENCYLTDDTQGFMVMVDKKTGTPFGTLGWTDMDTSRRQCIMGRLLLGNPAYRNSGPFVESFFLLGDYLYALVDKIYIHVGLKNRKAMHLNKQFGFRPNQGEIQYPQELFVQGDKTRPQQELCRNRAQYEEAKKRMFTDIEDLLYAE